MSSNSQRTRRAAAAAAAKRSEDDDESSQAQIGHRNGRNFRSLEKKSYCLDQDDDEIEEIKAPHHQHKTESPRKRRQNTNGYATVSGDAKPNLESVAKLESITGLSRAECIELLEACEQSLEKAIEIHFGGGSALIKNSKKSNGTSSISSNKPKIPNKRSHKEIDVDPIAISDDSNSQTSSCYQNDDNVRAPIAPKIERLVDYDPYGFEINNLF
jgi:hypothetical protein